MSTRYNNGSHYENHQRAAELHDEAAHVHRSAADHPGKQDHQTGQEMSRHAMEYSQRAFEATQQARRETNEHGIPVFGHDDIAKLAHQLWVERGSPEGSPEVDWFNAAEQLRSRSEAGKHKVPEPA